MSRKFLRAFVLISLLTVCALHVGAADDTVISDGVYIGDKDISGMTTDEVLAYVQEETEMLEDSIITLRMGDAEVMTTLKKIGLSWKNKDLIQEVSDLGTSGNIISRYKKQKDLENESCYYEIEYSFDPSLEEEFVKTLAAYDTEPVEGSIRMDDYGELYVEGDEVGYTLDVPATVERLQDQLDEIVTWDIVVDAVAEVTTPTISADILDEISDVLGTATTDYSASSESRAKNVEIGASKIDGTLLQPGEAFSVTEAVTPFTAEEGYELAPSYEAGSVVDSYGGGICQVSTTLYNAVLKAELEVDERHNHTMLVTYVDPSKDAAIAEGVMDFIFTNDTDSMIYIASSAGGGTLTFSIYGKETRPANRTIEFVSETLSTTSPANSVTLVAKTDQEVGYLYQSQSAHEGSNAVLWKRVYYDGVLSETIQVNSSEYIPSSVTYEVGVMTSNTSLSNALYAAIASNNLTQVQSLIANGVTTTTTTTPSADTSTVDTSAVDTSAADTSGADTAAAEQAADTGDTVTDIEIASAE